MKKHKWPLSSDQLELLVAFAQAGSLQGLAAHLAKDVSVVSRNLQRLAEVAPVIAKVKGRWQITLIGQGVIQLSADFLQDLHILLQRDIAMTVPKLTFSRTALIVINAQKGLEDGAGVDQTKLNILSLLNFWRSHGGQIVHVPHNSQNVESKFYFESDGAKFITDLAPKDRELTIPKNKSSGFSETNLAEILTSLDIQTVVLTGFTAGECIAATAHDGANLGFSVIVVSDATCSFDLFGAKGELHRADAVHATTLASLHNFFAKILTASELKNAFT